MLVFPLVVIFGLLTGSFLTCFKNRLDDLGSILVGRSACPKCKHNLGFLDLFPVLSFVLQGGCCRYCKKRISLEYPIVEMITAIIALAIYNFFGISASSVLLYVSFCLLIVASAVDIDDQEVHQYLLIIGIAVSILYQIIQDPQVKNLLLMAGGMLSAAFIPFVLYLVSREKWMGLGDSFFALWVGALCAYPRSLSAIMIAFISGALFGIIYLIIKKGSKKRVSVPFGPFIAFGGVASVFFGDFLIDSYLKLLGF